MNNLARSGIRKRVNRIAGNVAACLALAALTGCAAGRVNLRPTDLRAEVGVASYYAGKHHGRRTASGEVYDRNGFTAAHPRLPFGTRVQVTNLTNGKSIRLRINDRGPFVRGRVIDVSYRAARQLGFVRDGTARVRIEVLGG